MVLSTDSHHARAPGAALMTAARLRAVRAEFERLPEHTRLEIAERLREARSYGEGAVGSPARYRLTSAHDSIGPDVISAASPMGQALMGAVPGAVVGVELPNGRTRNVRLVDVKPPGAGWDDREAA